MNPKRILVIRTGGLGDTLLLWPAVSALRKRFSDARIELMGHRERCQLLVVPGGADRAVDIEGTGYHHLFEFSGVIPDEVRARFGNYDIILVFAAPGDYALAENLSLCGAREVHAFLSFPPSGDESHVASYARQCLVGQGLAVDERESLPLPVTDREQAEGDRRLEKTDLRAGAIAFLAPGSGTEAKNWTAQGYARLVPRLKTLGLQPALLQGPADRDAARAVLDNLEDDPPVVLDDLSPEVLKGVLRRASLLIGNDSGPAQLAAAIGVATVVIFGPTDPRRWKPQGPRVRVIHAGTPCAPCSAESMHECDERTCLSQITADQVLSACRDLFDLG